MEHYPDRLDAGDYAAMARDRARSGASGIGAVVVQREPGPAGQRWSAVVSDGATVRDIEVAAPDVPPHAGIDPLTVAEAVERAAAGAGPADERLARLGRVVLTAEDLRIV